MPKLRLTMRATQYITEEDDLDAPAPVRTMLVDRKVFDSAVSLAEYHGFRHGSRQLFCRSMQPSEANIFAKVVRRAMAAKKAPVGERVTRRTASDDHLREFLAIRSNSLALARLLTFVELGGELRAEEA
jgi:hypothetical protein